MQQTTLKFTKSGGGVMLGGGGDEFWRAAGGVKYAFYSKQQIDEGKSLYCREMKTYRFLYGTWKDRIRKRVVNNLKYGVLACHDPILQNMYAKRPPPFVRDEFINRRGDVVEVSDVFSVKTYPQLDALRRELVYKYPDVEFRGLVVDSVNFDRIREMKMEKYSIERLIARLGR